MSKIFTKSLVESLLLTPRGRITLQNALKKNDAHSEDIKLEIFGVSNTIDDGINLINELTSESLPLNNSQNFAGTTFNRSEPPINLSSKNTNPIIPTHSENFNNPFVRKVGDFNVSQYIK